MSVVSLRCNSCGAPLEAPQDARYLTCGFCGAQLQVQHSGSAYYTQVLEQLASRTDQLAEDVADLKLQSELERVDREWQHERMDLLVRDKSGQPRVPHKGASIAVMVVTTVIGLVWMSFAAGIGAGPMALFGIAFIAVGVFAGMRSMSKAHEYQQAHAAYQQRRRDVLDRLDDIQR